MRTKSSWLIIAGSFLIIFGATVLIATFYPIIKIEINYFLHKPKESQVVLQKDKSGSNQISPADEDFGLMIPKIGANAKVIANVDPYNEKIYEQALTHGVAHARGTALPNSQNGNTFLFSHSSVNFWEAVRYNSIFYLLGKLEKDDDIYIFYKMKKYHYKVTEKRVVNPQDIAYLGNLASQKYLTLMTCTPPGTTLKRLLVIAKQVSIGD